MKKKNVSVYIHIPFCINRRNGEAPNIYPSGRETRNQYLAALENELFAAGDLLENRQISSIYVGGGIASVLSPDPLARMLTKFKRSFNTAPGLELTIRAAPQTMVSPCLSGLNMCGFTRIELEVLSVSSKLLEQIGSTHRLSNVEDAYVMLDAFRVSNISSEVLFGIPTQTWSSLRNALVYTSSMSTKQVHIHLRPYELAQEEGMNEDELIEQYAKAKDFLEAAGFKEYGVGRFARDDQYCRFFLDECNGVERIGFGLGARSFIDGYAFQNTTNLKAYLADSPDYTKLIDQSIVLDVAAMQKRYTALRLQLIDGFALDDYVEKFGSQVQDTFINAFDSLQEQGLIEKNQNGYALSPRGKLNIEQVQQAILSASL